MSVVWCARCEEEPIVVPNFPEHAGDEPWCVRDAHDCEHFLCAKCKEEQENLDGAGDRELSAYYGGDGPQTPREFATDPKGGRS